MTALCLSSGCFSFLTKMMYRHRKKGGNIPEIVGHMPTLKLRLQTKTTKKFNIRQLFSQPFNWLSLLLVVSRYIEKNRLNAYAKMMNLILVQK